MSAPSVLESFDLLRFSDTFHSRLVTAREELDAKRGFDREKQWLASAVELLAAERAPVAGLLDRARGLPELADVAFELASSFQEVWVDALEKLLAGITFHAGSRSPVIEALFPHQKFPALRRANKEAAIAFATEFERRLKSGYVTRMMAGDEFAFVKPVLDQIATAYAKWHACFAPPPMPEEDAAKLREELPAVAKRLERAMAQARLVAEAALVPFEGAYDGTGLNAKPRKRSAKAEAPEAPPAEPAAPEQAEPAPKDAARDAPEDAPKDAKGKKAEPAAKDASRNDASKNGKAEASDAAAPEKAEGKDEPAEKPAKAKKPKKSATAPDA